MRVGLIARSDRTGLGNQTRNLARMLRPDEVMLIDSKVFNNNEQHPEMYDTYSVTQINGFPTDKQVIDWLRGVDIVVTCEIFYNKNFVNWADKVGVKTINHFNWEFADYLREPNLARPNVLLSPSRWHLEDAKRLWDDSKTKVGYLPTPVFVDDFREVREHNLARNGRKKFLHIAGRPAVNDRNGTQDLIQAMRYSRDDFELVIKTQTGAVTNTFNDPRITIDTASPDNEIELYRDFDALVLPRRYGGQCLPMTEALCAGLPVIMTDISPNNQILPKHWLVGTNGAGKFMTRTSIDLATVKWDELGQRLDYWSKKDLVGEKISAYNIGYREFSNYELESRWEKLISETYGKREDSIEDTVG